MNTFIRSACLAFGILFGCTFGATSADFAGQFACNDEETMRDALQNFGVPHDDDGNITVGCSLLPEGHKPEAASVVAVLDQVNCGPSFCSVVILRATSEGRVYYIGYGWLDKLDIELIGDMADAEPPFPEVVPCSISACELDAPTELAKRMLADLN